MHINEIITFLTSLLSAPAKSGHAYLDPGSGSFILQLLLAALVGSIFIIKSYWKKIAGYFRKLFTRRGSGEDE